MSMSSPNLIKPTVRHINNFDAIRLMAALLVIYGHSFALQGQVAPGWLGNGVHTIGVKIFFCISGFFITRSWCADPHPWRYFAKRCLRILPALSLNIVLLIVVLGPLLTTLSLFEYATSNGTAVFFKNIFLDIHYNLPGVFARNIYPHAVNGSLWTLPVEFLMYLTVPMLLMEGWHSEKFRKWSILVIIAAAIGLFLWSRYVDPRLGNLVFYGMRIGHVLELAPYFWIGAYFHLAKLDQRLSLPLAIMMLWIGSLVSLGPFWSEAYLYLCLPYVAVALGTATDPFLSKVSKFGDFSYGTYLWGFPVQQALSSLFGSSLSPELNAILALFIVIPLAACSWHLVEKRALAWKPGRLNPRVRASEASQFEIDGAPRMLALRTMPGTKL